MNYIEEKKHAIEVLKKMQATTINREEIEALSICIVELQISIDNQ